MSDNELGFPKQETADATAVKRKIIAEFIFIIFMGLVALGALYESLTNSFIAYRAPLVILVPLVFLIAIHGCRVFKESSALLTKANIHSTLFGGEEKSKSMAGIVRWMLGLIAVIYLAGHYIGISLFIFLLMRLSRESTALSVKVSAGATVIVYCLFELVLNVELYRGIIYMLWQGYTVF